MFEGLLVALAGGLLGFAANALSPRGLALARDYFPAPPPIAGQSLLPAPPETNSLSASDSPLAARLRSEGIQLADQAEVSRLFVDPAYKQGLFLFIDARSPENYAGGHIPGARLLDYYHPENYLGTVLPLCTGAQRVVVYCNGGDCEDSQYTAMLLRDAGVPREKLLVYGGGITEWMAKGLPVETGDCDSGHLLKH